MIQRFFLDGVDAKTGRAAIGGKHHLPATAFAHETRAALAVVQLAIAWTQIAL